MSLLGEIFSFLFNITNYNLLVECHIIKSLVKTNEKQGIFHRGNVSAHTRTVILSAAHDKDDIEKRHLFIKADLALCRFKSSGNYECIVQI